MEPKTNTLRCYRHSGPLDLKTLKMFQDVS